LSLLVSVGNFNGDGPSDLALVDQRSDTVSILFGQGVRGDFNGDGKPDIPWRNQATGGDVLWFMSGTNLAGGAVLPAVIDAAWEIVGTADFNGDGKTDILWRNRATGQNVAWFMNGAGLETLGGGAFLM